MAPWGLQMPACTQSVNLPQEPAKAWEAETPRGLLQNTDANIKDGLSGEGSPIFGISTQCHLSLNFLLANTPSPTLRGEAVL